MPKDKAPDTKGKALSVEELLKPRYKVIADYPGSPFTVGEIIDWTDTTETQKRAFIMRSQSGHGLNKNVADKYPHLFKPLQWYEEREEKDMPEYIRLNQITVCKVRKHFTSYNGRVAFMDTDTKYDYPYDIAIPATEAEYITQIKKP